MTNYIDQDGLTERFGPDEILNLIDADGDGSPDQGRLDAVIEDVEAEINTAIVENYDVPVADCPLLSMIAADLCRERLYDDEVPEAVAERARESRRTLSNIARGEFGLLDSSNSLVPTRSDPAPAAAARMAAYKETDLQRELEYLT